MRFLRASCDGQDVAAALDKNLFALRARSERIETRQRSIRAGEPKLQRQRAFEQGRRRPDARDAFIETAQRRKQTAAVTVEEGGAP